MIQPKVQPALLVAGHTTLSSLAATLHWEKAGTMLGKRHLLDCRAMQNVVHLPTFANNLAWCHLTCHPGDCQGLGTVFADGRGACQWIVLQDIARLKLVMQHGTHTSYDFFVLSFAEIVQWKIPSGKMWQKSWKRSNDLKAREVAEVAESPGRWTFERATNIAAAACGRSNAWTKAWRSSVESQTAEHAQHRQISQEEFALINGGVRGTRTHKTMYIYITYWSTGYCEKCEAVTLFCNERCAKNRKGVRAATCRERERSNL